MELSKVFSYEGYEVRTVVIDGVIWFVVKDACDVLGISQYRHAIGRLDDDERASLLVHTLGGNQEMACVNESGLYSLILTSRKPEAKAFKKWITSEVLPEIRKTGGYSPKSKSSLEILFDTVKELVVLNDKVDGIEDRVVLLEGGKVSKSYYTVKRFACKHGYVINRPDASKAGKKASTACRAKSIEIEKQLDDNFELVGAYPEFILEDVFASMNIPKRNKAG